MTPKKTELHDGEKWVDMTDDVLAEPVSLDGMTAAQAIALLRDLKAKGGPVLITAPIGEPRDSVVVDSHYFAGENRAGAWWFHPISLDMAVRMVGFTSVETLAPGRLRLS